MSTSFFFKNSHSFCVVYCNQIRTIQLIPWLPSDKVCNLDQVEEGVIMVDELIHADEVFCTGTAVGVAPVGSITYQGKR